MSNYKTALQRMSRFDCCPSTEKTTPLPMNASIASLGADILKELMSVDTVNAFYTATYVSTPGDSVYWDGSPDESLKIDQQYSSYGIFNSDGLLTPMSSIRYCLHCYHWREYVLDTDLDTHTFSQHLKDDTSGVTCVGSGRRIGEVSLRCNWCHKVRIKSIANDCSVPKEGVHTMMMPTHKIGLNALCQGSSKLVAVGG